MAIGSELNTTERQNLAETLEFIRTYIEYGDLTEAAAKFRISTSHASKLLNGKVKRPKVEFLKFLKDKALRNYNKLRL